MLSCGRQPVTLHLAGDMGQRYAQFVELRMREVEQLSVGVGRLGPKLRDRFLGRSAVAADHCQIDVRTRLPITDRPRTEQHYLGVGQPCLQVARQRQGARIGYALPLRQVHSLGFARQSRIGHAASGLRSHRGNTELDSNEWTGAWVKTPTLEGTAFRLPARGTGAAVLREAFPLGP